MNYDYKIINTDPTIAFVKRMLLYIAILCVTISLALIILFILFEKYIMLILPGGMILISVLLMLGIARKTSFYTYHFSNIDLKIIGGRSEIILPLCNLIIEKNAETSDFFDKSIIKLSFIKNRIILRSIIDHDVSIKNVLIYYNDKRYIVALDDYAHAIILGAKDENQVL